MRQLSIKVHLLYKLGSRSKQKILIGWKTDDEFTAVLTNHDKEFYGDFWVSTTIAGFLAGEVYLAEDQDGNIAGVAVWFPPGREMYDR